MGGGCGGFATAGGGGLAAGGLAAGTGFGLGGGGMAGAAKSGLSCSELGESAAGGGGVDSWFTVLPRAAKNLFLWSIMSAVDDLCALCGWTVALLSSLSCCMLGAATLL